MVKEWLMIIIIHDVGFGSVCTLSIAHIIQDFLRHATSAGGVFVSILMIIFGKYMPCFLYTLLFKAINLAGLIKELLTHLYSVLLLLLELH